MGDGRQDGCMETTGKIPITMLITWLHVHTVPVYRIHKIFTRCPGQTLRNVNLSEPNNTHMSCDY